MSIVVKRRLRVRDDGSGESRELDASFADFANEGAVVLLGDPGLGKTTLFREESEGRYVTVRNFLIDPRAAATPPIFLDGLDEYRTLSNGSDVCAEVAKTLCTLDKPKFRLSCRSADWFGSTDQDALRVASPFGRIVVLQLYPLTRAEILIAVRDLVADPEKFLEEAEAAGMSTLLGNPQTLELIARAWGTARKPRNRFEAYQIGISELLKESNVLHAARGSAGPDPNNLRQAAGAIASTLLLSNSTGVSRTEAADGNGYIGLAVVPHPDKQEVDAALKRKLFTSSAPDRLEPAHRTITEFLAAEDLAERIQAGLPIDRVMALMSGFDGSPVSSLRGLFAWLVCRLGSSAEAYIGRDPYAAATYGDASVLTPKAQCCLWLALKAQRDPWFLANGEDRGSFRELANPNTATIVRQILQDTKLSPHLRIAALEAIVNSTTDIGLGPTVRALAIDRQTPTWLRTTAIKAFANCVKGDWPALNALDQELAAHVDDAAVHEVRLELFHLTKQFGPLAERLLSIMKQAVSATATTRVIGHFSRLADVPTDADLDALLDGASVARSRDDIENYEIHSLFDEWLGRRLTNTQPIAPAQLARWLRTIRFDRDRERDRAKVHMALKARLAGDAGLFEATFECLATELLNAERSFWLFVAHDVWRMLPSTVWPMQPAAFLIARAEREMDASRAEDLFRMYLLTLPREGTTIELAEAGFALIARRKDVRKTIGRWNVCKIEKWRTDQVQQREKRDRKAAAARAKALAYLIPRLATIREGKDENALVWAIGAYFGFFNDVDNDLAPRDRLVSVSSEEAADALIEGFSNYADSPTIPTKQEIFASRIANSIPWKHWLLSLSVFLRHQGGRSVPDTVLVQCVATVLVAFPSGDDVPGFDKGLSGWLIHQARNRPAIVASVLREMWITCATTKHPILPGFYDLKEDAGSHQFLTDLCADVLRTGIADDHGTVSRLIAVLMAGDRQNAREIGEAQIDRPELSPEVRALWATTLFAIDPDKHLGRWTALATEPETALWQAIELISGSEREKLRAIGLSPAQRFAVVSLIGKRFPYTGHPFSGWNGSQNPWDASEFVVNQIAALASDETSDADSLIAAMAADPGLASYHDQIRHRWEQRVKRQRETTFSFAAPAAVADAIRNLAPATPRDFLAYVTDHLEILARELRATQKERFRAYWNQDGRTLLKPKREEDCSGLLAEDLQNRIRPHGLIVTVEHHMIADKECDLVVLHGTDRLLPLEAKHHYHAELWTAWRTQLDKLYTRDAGAGGLGIYVVFWSGEAKDRKMPKLPTGVVRPTNAGELKGALEALIPTVDRHRLRVVVIDISLHTRAND